MIAAGIASIDATAGVLASAPTGPSRAAGALARMAARSSAARQNASAGIGHDVSRSDRTRRRFSYISGLYASADRQIAMTNLPKLRELCRAHDRNSALISGILNRALDNIFGDAFGFIPNTGDTDLNAIVKEYIDRRMTAEHCDAAGVDDFVAMARTSVRGVWTDGDSLMVFRPDGSMIPFEADQILTPRDFSKGPGRDRNETKNSIVMGVEKSRLGRHLRYHVSQRPETGKETETKAVRPENCIFPSFRTRHRQTRGLPYLASAMSIFERLDGFIDSETFAAELNARTALAINKAPSEDDPDGVTANDDPATSDTFSKLQKIESGQIIEGQPGETIGMVESMRPGPQFEPYIVVVARIVGAAVGMPLELVLLDFSRTSWASGRLSMDEARRTFRFWQKFSDVHICDPWYKRQITRGIATGELPADDRIYKKRTHWATWPYIQPQQAATANQIQIANRTKSISECIREQNRDPETVFNESADDFNTLRELGIPPQMLPQGVAEGASGSGGDEDNDK